MLKSLEIFGFGENFIEWITILNANTYSCINYCGWLSGWFPLECGIRQGCPISPLIFILACELLSCNIRQMRDIKGIKLPIAIGDRNEIKLLQFADDTTLFLADEMSIKLSLQIIEKFSEFTGLNLNKRKTEAIWLGCWKFRKRVTENLKWNIYPNNGIKVLGVKFKNDTPASNIDLNWSSKITKCENIIKMWLGRNLTIIGKITLIKTFLIPQFIYLMQGLIPPKCTLDRINRLLFKFIWSKKQYRESDLALVVERVKRETLIHDYNEGGLRMIDIRQMQYSLAIKWISKLSMPGDGIWRALPLYYLNKFGQRLLIFQMNTQFRDLRGWEKYYPQFYKSLIEIWYKIPSRNNEHDLENSSEVIWNNDLFKYKGKIIFNKRWINKDIICVGDLISDYKIIDLLDFATKNRKLSTFYV